MSALNSSSRALLCAATLASATVVHAQHLRGVNPFSNTALTLPQTGGLFNLDPVTGAIFGGQAITLAGFTVTGANGLAVDPSTNEVYAILKVATVSGRVLAKLDLASGVATQVGNLGDNFASLAFRGAQLYGVTGDGALTPETLYLIDKTSAAKTLATALGNGADGEVIAWNPADDMLYHWSGRDPVVFEKVLPVPPYTVTPIFSDSAGGEVSGAVWNPASSRFLAHNLNRFMQSWATDGTRSDAQAATTSEVRGLALLDRLQIGITGTGAGTVTSSLGMTPVINCAYAGGVASGDCDESYAAGTVATLVATPAAGGSVFAGWSGDADCADGVVTLSVDVSCTATFTLPALSITDVTVAEGNAGTTNAVFTVTLSPASPLTVTVSASTSDLSALAGSDYTAVGPLTLTFTPMATSRTFAVPILGDLAVESDETFRVTLSSPANALIADGEGIGTITNDDGAPPSRVFVSVSGSDANVCSTQAAPCRNIAAAIGQVANDGEVIVLSSGEYETAPLVIAKGVKITSPTGTVAFVRQPITINAAGARVALRGLTLKGAGAGSAVTLAGADSLSIEETTFDSWNKGLDLANPAASNVAVTNAAFILNGTAISDGGAALTTVAIAESRFEGNTTGVAVSVGSFAIRGSHLGANTTGIVAIGGSIDVSRCEIWGNGTGVQTSVDGAAAIFRSHVFGNAVGLSAGSGSTLVSAGTNVIRGNATDTQGTIGATSEQ